MPSAAGSTAATWRKKRSDSCQSGVACVDGVVAVLFEVIEKGQHEIAVEILNRQLAHGPAVLFGGVGQEKFHRIPVGSHGVRADATLSDEVSAEERLE